MGASDLTRARRRQMILDAIRSKNYAATGREYGLDRKTVQHHASKAIRGARERYEEAREELAFRREVLELLDGKQENG